MSNTTAIDTPTRTQQVDGKNLRSEDVQKKIRERAYELFEARGAIHGHDMEDWVIAEREIVATRPASRAA